MTRDVRLLSKATLLLLCLCFDSIISSITAYQTAPLFLLSLPIKPTPKKLITVASTSSTSIDVDEQLDQSSSSSNTNNTSSLYPAAFRRALEIGIILGGKVVGPILISSAFRIAAKDYDEGGWDTFWSTTTPSSFFSSKHAVFSHATRLANALEALGPTYVKFGQALGSRPDVVPPSLAVALSALQDDMAPFGSMEAREIVKRELIALATSESSQLSKEDIEALVSSLSELPVAAASLGVVYEAYLPAHCSERPPIRVAVKVQRPGVRQIVEQDSKMLLAIAQFLDSIPAFSFLPNTSTSTSLTSSELSPMTERSSKRRLIKTQLVPAVQEFMSRILEELDYRNEANNIITFANLYSEGAGSSSSSSNNNKIPLSKRVKHTTIPRVVVPKVYLDWCTENVLVMEWIDGTKLTNVRRQTTSDPARVNDGNEHSIRGYADADINNKNEDGDDDDRTRKENLALVKVAIDCTLHQLLVTGVLHADPHAGNLVKILNHRNEEVVSLGYLDFGLLSTIPERVRDALVCAVALQVFERDAHAVASLFGELHLIPQHVLDDRRERAALAEALRATFDNALLYPAVVVPTGKLGNERDDDSTVLTAIPELKFDKLLDSLSRLVPRFQFDLPPYFINNARALSTLEGIAKSLDPTFNVLAVMYPYALNRLLRNPTRSPVVERTVQTLIRSPSKDGGGGMIIDRHKIRRLLKDSASITGLSQPRLIWDIVKTKPGRKLTRDVLTEELQRMMMYSNTSRRRKRKKKRNKWYYLQL